MRSVAESRATTLVHLLIFFLLISYICPRCGPLVGHGPLICVGVTLAVIFESRRLLVIALLNIFAGAITIAGRNTPSDLWFLHILPLRDLALSVEIYLTTTAFFYVYLISTINISRTLVTLPLMAAVGTAAVYYFDMSPFGRGCTLLLILGVWHNCFYLMHIKRLREIRIVDFLVCQRPFFTSYLMPAPPLLSEIAGPADSEERMRSQRNAIKLLLLSAICMLALEKSTELSARMPLFGATVSTDVRFLYTPTMPLGESWLAPIVMFSRLLLYIMSFVGPAVASCQMMGMNAPMPIGNFFSSRTFGQYFSKVNRYYSIMISDLFLYPLFRNLYFLRTRSVRLLVSVAVAITGGGLIHHFFRIVLFDAGGLTSQPILPRLYPAGAYWLALAVGICLSIVVERRFLEGPSSRIATAGRSLLYFVFNSLLLVFSNGYLRHATPFAERARVLLSLLGLRL